MIQTYIIAEIGVNHNGDITLAKKMILSAKESGADCVKFQAFSVSELLSANTPLAEYQYSNLISTQNDLLKRYELSIEELYELKLYSEDSGIDFLLSVFDVNSLKALRISGINKWKVPSGEITNFFLLNEISLYDCEVILSTGMSTLSEIQSACNVLLSNSRTIKINLLHCVSEYPVPVNEINLNSIKALRETFNYNVGFSDHTSGIEIPVLAVAAGATIIEKHFTLNKDDIGPDHKASLEPLEFSIMVNKIKELESIMGKEEIMIMPSEKKNITIVRKSLFAKNEIKKGEIFTMSNLTSKRPGIGISPMKIDKLLGKKSMQDYSFDEMIMLCEIE